jgi:hypothetical protein
VSVFDDKDMEALGNLITLKLEEQRKNNPCEFCSSTDRRMQHRKDHEFIQSLNQLFDRLANVRWSILQGLLTALVIAGVLGAIAFTWGIVRNP